MSNRARCLICAIQIKQLAIVSVRKSERPLPLDTRGFEALAGQYRVPPHPWRFSANSFISTTVSARAVRRSVQQSQLPVQHHELSQRDENQHCAADSGHGFSHKSGGLRLFPTLFEITLIGTATQGEYLENKNDPSSLS